MKKNVVVKWVMLFLILLFPSLLYIILSTGEINFIALPKYGPKKVVETTNGDVDTLYYQIPGFQLADQTGKTVSLGTFQNDVKVFNFLCTDCGSFSERVVSEIAQLHLQFEKHTDLSFISIVLSEDGTINQSKLLGDNEMSDDWFLLPTKPNLARSLAKKALLIDEYDKNKGTDQLVLVDKQNRIRGYYNGKEYLEVKELIDAIKVLKAEEFIPRKEK